MSLILTGGGLCPAEPTGPFNTTPTPSPWFELDAFQETLTRDEFERKLTEIFDPYGGMEKYMEVDQNRAIFYPTETRDTLPEFELRFAPSKAERRDAPRRFRTPYEIRNRPKPPSKPLQGLRVALDPGHIGGDWARMEHRSVRYRGKGPVQEGDHVLLAAKILRGQLEELGAEVFLVREDATPVTPYRPEDFTDQAREILYERNPSLREKYQGLPVEEQNKKLGYRLQRLSEILFFRGSEIEERGRKISTEFNPDVTISMHFNATANSGRGRLVNLNRHIFFVHGAYTAGEVDSPNQRLRLLYKILENPTPVEVEVASAIADAFAEMTGFPSVLYGNSANTREVRSGYKRVVARNLAANRLYDGPVVFSEPYLMNQRHTYQRLLAGDYEGLKKFSGQEFPSIYQEYADGITNGLLDVYAPRSYRRPESKPLESVEPEKETEATASPDQAL
ncbi:MAG: hypothetical protein AAGK14_00740 [Verrucomicrobiota bacterium]